MSASSINGFMNIPIPSGTAPVTLYERTERDSDQEGSATMALSRARPDSRPLLNAVTQTLGQIGLGQPGLIAVNGPKAAPKASGNNILDRDTPGDAAANASVDQSLQKFMHVLFQSLAPRVGSDVDSDSSGSSPPLALADSADQTATAMAPAGYTNLATQLQNLVQSLGSHNDATKTAGSDLNEAFQSLAQALGASTGRAGGNSQANLQSFLQDLLQNLQSTSNSSLNGLGNSVKTFA